MPIIAKKGKSKLFKVFLTATCIMTLGAPVVTATHHANASTAYDISQYQGYLRPYQVKRLKKEVSFLVLRSQYGGLYPDSTFAHNAKLLQKYHVPYGVYSYSLYANKAQARAEAKALHARAPKARFYANDLEEDHAGYGLNSATAAWAKEIHSISYRPAVLYSGEYFMNTHITQATRNDYNAIWLAAYGAEPNTPYHYDLWQFSSNYYSRALGQALDADTFPDGNDKTLQFWIGNSSKHGASKSKRSVVKPMNTATAKATKVANKAAVLKKAHPKSKTANKRVANYKQEVNQLAKKANDQSQEIQQLKNENKQQAITLNKNDKTIHTLENKLASLKRTAKQVLSRKGFTPKKNSKFAKTSRSPKGKVANGYYTSKHIHYVKVTNRDGINIYDHNDNHKIAHVDKNTIVHVLYFKPEHYDHKIITRAVGDYGWNSDGSARQVVFTSNKNFVHMIR